MADRLSYNLIRRKALKEYKYPEPTADKIVIRSSSSGIGYQTHYQEEWGSIINKKDFLEHLKQINELCYSVYFKKKKQAMEGVKPWVYTTMKIGLLTIAVSVMVVLAVVFSIIFGCLFS